MEWGPPHPAKLLVTHGRSRNSSREPRPRKPSSRPTKQLNLPRNFAVCTRLKQSLSVRAGRGRRARGPRPRAAARSAESRNLGKVHGTYFKRSIDSHASPSHPGCAAAPPGRATRHSDADRIASPHHYRTLGRPALPSWMHASGGRPTRLRARCGPGPRVPHTPPWCATCAATARGFCGEEKGCSCERGAGCLVVTPCVTACTATLSGWTWLLALL